MTTVEEYSCNGYCLSCGQRYNHPDYDGKKPNMRVTAIFDPPPDHLETLVPELKIMVGKSAEFRYLYQMTDRDPFPKEWILVTDDPRFQGYFIPEFDLDILEEKYVLSRIENFEQTETGKLPSKARRADKIQRKKISRKRREIQEDR